MKTRVKEFCSWGGDEPLTDQINNWLKKHDTLEIVDIKYSISLYLHHATCALVIYGGA